MWPLLVLICQFTPTPSSSFPLGAWDPSASGHTSDLVSLQWLPDSTRGTGDLKRGAMGNDIDPEEYPFMSMDAMKGMAELFLNMKQGIMALRRKHHRNDVAGEEVSEEKEGIPDKVTTRRQEHHLYDPVFLWKGLGRRRRR